MQWLASISVRRPIFATVLILFVVVVGIVGYSKLNVDRFPNVDLPVVSIITTLPGAAPEEIETELTDKIEEAVNTISGIDELRSISTEGVSQVFVTFLLDKNVDIASQEVRDHLATVLHDLPEGTESPVVSKLDPDAAPVLFVAVESDRSIRDITELADHQIRQSLESISGVGQVTIIGGHKRQVQVLLDPNKLKANGLTASDVRRAIVAQNVTTPGGTIDTGPQRLTFRVRGRVPTVPAVGDIIIRQVDSHPLLVSDVARVVDGEEEADTSAVLDGKPAVVLSIRKQSGENSVAVVDALREQMKDLERMLPGKTKLSVIRDNTETTRTSVDAVREHLVLGALLASLVVLHVPGQLPQHADRGARDPDVDHRHVHGDVADGLHAQHHHAAGAGAGGRHRHRRRDRRAGEHLPLHRREEDAADAGGDLRHARDRPRRAGDDAVAAGGVHAGRVHGRHPRALPAQLRPDHGLLDRDLAVRQLHADADAGVALAAHGPAPGRRAQEVPARARRRRVLPADRAALHAHPLLRDRSALDRGAGGGGDARHLRAAGQEGAEGLPAQERRGAVRDHAAHHRGEQPGGDGAGRRAHRARGAHSGPR